MTFPRSILAEQAALGRAGRVAPPAGWTPTDGTAALVLGSDVPGVVVPVSAGDAIEARPRGDCATDTAYIRFKAHFRPPAVPPPGGVFWRFTAHAQAAYGGSPSARVTLDLVAENAREATHVDFAIPVVGVLGGTSHEIALRLELVGTPGDYELELPGVYVDSVILDAQATRPTPINRVPDNGDVGVPVDAPLVIEVNDPNVVADTFNGSIQDLQVYVGGLLAYDANAGGFQTGFTGPDSAATLHSAGLDGHRTARVVIDPLANFAGSAVVPVLIRARTFDADSPREYSYSFVTEDITAPTLVAAVATDRRTVQVTTSEPVDDATALDVSNWSVTVASTSLDDGLPAVAATVISVTKVADTIFLLGLAAELTRGALYVVEGGPIEDLVGNPMAAPNNRAFFFGYACAGPDGRDFDLLGHLPDVNVNEDESGDLRKFIGSFQEVVDGLLCDIDHWTDILDPDIAPERFVDAMLVDLGNPFDFDLSDVDKRRLVRVLVPIYMQKGTDPGIINAARFFVGVEVTILVGALDGAWVLGLSELGAGTVLGSSDLRTKLSFYVVSDVALTQTQRDQIQSIVVYMKDARTHFLGIIEPEVPSVPSHWELGLSELGTETLLH